MLMLDDGRNRNRTRNKRKGNNNITITTPIPARIYIYLVLLHLHLHPASNRHTGPARNTKSQIHTGRGNHTRGRAEQGRLRCSSRPRPEARANGVVLVISVTPRSRFRSGFRPPVRNPTAAKWECVWAAARGCGTTNPCPSRPEAHQTLRVSGSVGEGRRALPAKGTGGEGANNARFGQPIREPSPPPHAAFSSAKLRVNSSRPLSFPSPTRSSSGGDPLTTSAVLFHPPGGGCRGRNGFAFQTTIGTPRPCQS